MLLQIATFLEISYLTYMFYFFKTTFEIHHPLESSVVSISDYLKHPIKSGYYESKICLFGKHAMIGLLGFLSLRLFITIPPIVNFIVVLVASILSFLNLNAFLYLLPYIITEFWLMYNL